MGKIILITGGVRSGKSSWALRCGNEIPAEHKIFIATAKIIDEEMRERAEKHQEERGRAWRTIEEPVALAETLANLTDKSVSILDCCTVWLGNIWHRHGNDRATLENKVAEFCCALD
jgi:adenosylcobinamide kinase / adenosylcobinamide-phosphate guanylyltransferase